MRLCVKKRTPHALKSFQKVFEVYSILIWFNLKSILIVSDLVQSGVLNGQMPHVL
jgi:hypothetical protein